MAETTYGKDRTRKESRGLLDDEELNLGSSAVIPVPFARPFTENDVKAGNPVRLVDLKTDSRLGRTVSIVMTQSVQESDASPIANTSGPIIGIVEFTSGAAGIIRIEFDVPSISRVPTITNDIINSRGAPFDIYPASLVGPVISGVSLCVPASSVRVYARNDNNIGLVWQPNVIIGSDSEEDRDPTVNASVCYGEVFGANKHLKRTVYIVDSGVPMTVGGFATIGIPPFAKSVRFPRQSMATTLGVTFVTIFGTTFGVYPIAVGSDGPLEIPPGSTTILISNTSAITISDLAAVFDLAI